MFQLRIIDLLLITMTINQVMLTLTIENNVKIRKNLYDNVFVMLAQYSLLSLNQIEDSYLKVKQKQNNKKLHSKYGNKQNKPIKHLKLAELNKGSYFLPKYIELIKLTIKEKAPDVLVMPEANIRDEDNLESYFPEYNDELKYLNNLQ